MKAFSIIAALATAVQAVALITLHLLPTGYDPVRDAVSDYGVGRYRGWFWLQAVAGGVGCLALAIALAQLHPFTPTQAVIALVAATVARFLIPFFATDQDGNRFQTLHGTIHMILAVIAFGGLVWAATSLWSTLSHYPAWHGAEGALTIIPWIMLGSVIAVVLAIRGPRLKPFFGLFERLFYLSSITWVLIVAIDLARISGLAPGPHPKPAVNVPPKEAGMPTVTVEGKVTLQQAATALQDRLGSRYEVTTHGSGAQQALKVKQSAASTATVHLDQDGNATTFHVHGGGLVISRMVNEFGIAKKVAATIEEAFAARPAS